MWEIIKTKKWQTIRDTFDWVRDMEGVPQDPIYHAEGDVGTHTKMVLDALLTLPEYQQLTEQDQHILFASALLHDVEKRSTTIIELDGRITSKGHARRGALTARRLLYRDIISPFVIREAIVKLVRYHGLPLWVFDKPDPQKALLQASLEVNTSHLAMLAKADVLGRICRDQANLLYKIELFEAFCQEQHCWGVPRIFENNLARFHYFQKESTSPNYVPFDNTKFEVILLCGLPGSGKDTFIKKHFGDYPVISLDNLRRQMKIAPSDSKGTGKVIQAAREQARIFMRKHKSFVWNATNLNRQLRSQLIDLFVSYKGRVKIIYLEVPYRRLVEQNRNREHIVPSPVLEKMIKKWEVPSVVEAVEVQWNIMQ